MAQGLYFVDKIDYAKSGDTSIWGTEDQDTLQFLKNYSFSGRWLNLAAGDGRYNNLLLQTADTVVATDIDVNALLKLKRLTPKDFTLKLQLMKIDLNHHFPFGDGTFDGIFCTGILHLFPESHLKLIFHEIDRCLKYGGQLLFDFATDIERLAEDGSKLKNSGVNYTLDEAKPLLNQFLPHFESEFVQCGVPKEWIGDSEKPHFFSCKYWLVKAKKQLQFV